MQEKYLTTAYPNIFFEDNKVGRLKKRLWDASEEEIQAILDDYGIPSDSEIGKPGCYIQTSPRKMVIEKRHKNDIVLVPIGCTENHGIHNNSGQGQLQRHIEKKEEKRKGQSIKRPRLGSSCTLFQPSLRGSRRQGSISS